MSSIEKYRAIFTKILDITSSIEEAEYKYSENWSSLNHIVLISEIEDEFDVVFSPEEIIEFQSYQKGLEILKRKNVIEE